MFDEDNNETITSMQELTSMLNNLNFECNIEAKEQILSNLFEVFEIGYRMTCHSPHIIKFLSKMIILGLKIDSETNNRFTMLYGAFNIQNRMDNLLMVLAKQEAAVSNKNRFVFWKLLGNIFDELYPVLRENEGESLIAKLISQHDQYRKRHGPTHQTLNDKAMVYIADCMDKAFMPLDLSKLTLIELILKKFYRRYSKETLQRLAIFYNSKAKEFEQ